MDAVENAQLTLFAVGLKFGFPLLKFWFHIPIYHQFANQHE